MPTTQERAVKAQESTPGSAQTLRVIMKDGRTFDGALFDRQYDTYKHEGWLSLAVDHLQHPEVPEIFLFEECARVIDLARPDVDLLPAWQGLKDPPEDPSINTNAPEGTFE